MGDSFVVPLRRPSDALVARVALIEAAEATIEVQYYLWDSGPIGHVVFDRLIDAADRGVEVRIIVDDLKFRQRTRRVASLCTHPNVEIRLFNPWSRRANAVTQGIEFIRRFAKLDQRMHNKLLVVDGRQAIFGGRNLGGEHFGISGTMNLVDFDMFLAGDDVPAFVDVFESYWNSPLAVVGSALDDTVTDVDFATTHEALAEELRRQTPDLESMLAEQRDWPQRQSSRQITLASESVTVVSDTPGVAQSTPGTQVIDALREAVDAARHDIVVATPFFVPSEADVQWYGQLVDRGAHIRVLTNSLASNPGTISNSGLQKERAALLRAGVELHELRTDAAAKFDYDVGPHIARYLGLHAKLYVIDRQRTFLGSVNLDPRSKVLNTEMGVVIDNTDLATVAADAILQLTTPDNAWEVTLDPGGRLRWRNDIEELCRQPARGPGQRLADLIFGLLPLRNYI
jgi:putative cardiolipin synthase